MKRNRRIDSGWGHALTSAEAGGLKERTSGRHGSTWSLTRAMFWQMTARISRCSRLCCLPALRTRVSVGILPVAGDREAPSAVAQPGAGSGVHGRQSGELERGDAGRALPGQRTVRCPLAGFTGRPEAAGRDVADHASPAGAVSAAPPGQEVIMRGALTARNRTAGRKMTLPAGSRSANPAGRWRCRSVLLVPVWCCPVLNSAVCAHNPEVAGSNPAPRYQVSAGQRPDRRERRSGLLAGWQRHGSRMGPHSAASGGRDRQKTSS
jgi:hypothetical protein